MPKPNIINLKCTVVLSCGKVFTEDEWISSPRVFSYDKNQAIIDTYAIESDSNYYIKLRAERRFQKIETRHAEMVSKVKELNNTLY